MVSIVTKNIKGNTYLYLVDSIRQKSKVRQVTIKYIGKKRPIPKEEFECMKLSYKNNDWILNSYDNTLSYQDHNTLNEKSELYKEFLDTLDPVSLDKEKKKFLSTFISNSSAIEGSTLTPNETYQYLFEDLVPVGKTKKELYMADNLLRAWEYLTKHKDSYPTIADITELHAIVNQGIEGAQTLGKIKPVQNYIGDKLTSSYLFAEEKLVELLHWIKTAKQTVDEFEIAFQSHAQFEYIHPFVDGNGRVGRLLLNWLLLKENKSPLAITFSKRGAYIESLENATRGKLLAITTFCFKEYYTQYDFI